MKPIEIILYKNELKTIIKFSKGRSRDYQYYEKSRLASTPNKDSILGKCGEAAAAKILSENKIIVKPDYTHYKVKDKSFDADLGGNIHCKTCSKSTRLFLKKCNNPNWYSWTFQSIDNIIKEPEKHQNDYVILMYMTQEHKEVDYAKIESIQMKAIAILPWTVGYAALEDPLARKYIGTKQVINHKNKLVQNFIKNNRWDDILSEISYNL